MASARDPTWRLRGFARLMRHDPSKAEKKLWEELRGRRLGGFKFRRQVPIEGYIVDFYCDDKKLAIELDGEQHHEVGARQYDERRDWRLERLGNWTLRFPSLSVLNEMSVVRESILEALQGNPHPGPLPAYRARE